MNRRPRMSRSPRRERGAVLLIALVLLGMMLLLSVSAMDSSLIQEKMAANTRDRGTAFESNEAAARNAFDVRRQLISAGRALPDNSLGYYNSGALPDGTGVRSDTASLAYWERYPLSGTNSQQSSLAATATVNRQGRFLIEHMRFDDESEPGSATVYSINFSSITASGAGNNGGNVVTQSTLMTLPR
ncbi:MAG TPA: PilX N-terminal domain-containing pilus assembly protein [Burkholderiaceae bacterium]|nr:PilX N-terminal domain-containing pilus assembly protein [Burkholderiaceae bacterium]